MKHVNWNQEYPEVPDCVHRSVMDALSALDEQDQEVQKMKKTPKKRMILLAAALTAVIGTSAAAAGVFKWNDRAGEVFQADEAMQNQLSQDLLAQEVSQSVTDQGLTITAIQTIQDQNRFYALFEVTAEDPELIISPEYSLDYTTDMGGQEDLFSAMGWGFVSEMEQEESNTRYFEIDGLKNEQSEDNLIMNLHFTALRGEPEKKAGEGEVLISGSWDFSLDIHASEMIFHEVNKECSLGGYPMHIKSVEVSPLSIRILCDGADVRAMEAGKGICLDQLDSLTELYPTGVRYADGTVVDEGMMFPLREGFRDEEASYGLLLSCDKVLDADQVTAVLFGEEEVTF